MSKSKQLAEKLIYAALTLLKEHDGELAASSLKEKIPSKVDLDDWAKSTLEKTGNVRWDSVLQFYSIDLKKAEFIIKNKGVWYLTPEGENALSKGSSELFKMTQQAYKDWKNSQPEKHKNEEPEDNQIAEELSKTSSILDEARSKGNLSFTKYIKENFDAYSFQDLCAALFRGMGYYTPFVAPKGKDGGIDIVAYKDPIGGAGAHIKIQVKYRNDSKATAQELRELKGVVASRKNSIGVFVSIAGFTSDATKEFQNSDPHIELIDLEKFIDLWQEFYPNMTDSDKSLMPIEPVYFISKDES